jgi:hypothetical protein
MGKPLQPCQFNTQHSFRDTRTFVSTNLFMVVRMS